VAEYTESMHRAWERSQAEGRARMQRLNEDLRLQQRSLAEKIYGKSSDGQTQRLRSIAAGKAKQR
jgi:hypothetical protein